MKHLLALFLLSTSSSAMATCGEPGGQCAPTLAPTLVNQGAICNTVKSSASVTGLGSSLSYAAGSASATANGGQSATSLTPTSRTLDLTGATQASTSGVAYNASTGNGTGSASSIGTASAALSNAANAGYTTNGVAGSLHVQGTSNSVSGISIVADKNQGGTAQASTSGTFIIHGDVSATKTGNTTVTGSNPPNTGDDDHVSSSKPPKTDDDHVSSSKPPKTGDDDHVSSSKPPKTGDDDHVTSSNPPNTGVNTNVVVVGSVTDSKTTQSEVLTGLVQNSATGQPITYLAPATTSGNASTVVNVSGSFTDPTQF